MMVMVMVMMPFVRNFYLISDYVFLFCPVRSVTLTLSAIGPLSALPLFDVCSSSVQDLLCLCSFICVSPLNNSLTFFALSQFFLFGIWGKQDGTSNCAWGGRGQCCSSLVSGSPQPPPGYLLFSLSPHPLLTINNISEKGQERGGKWRRSQN